MTVREAYENILMELNKVNAPSLHLENYNYWMNKGIQEYVNERYRLFETSQQVTDDIQPLIDYTTCTITATGISNIFSGTYTGGSAEVNTVTIGKKYNSDFIRVKLPENYFHLLGVSPTIVTNFPYKCYNVGFSFQNGAKKLTADVGNGPALNNAYLKPGFKNPYYQIQDGLSATAAPDILILAGNLTKFSITDFNLDYLRKPVKIELTVAQRDNIPNDISDVLEFPEYACHEIVKRVVKLLLENGSDPRLTTHLGVNNTIQ